MSDGSRSVGGWGAAFRMSLGCWLMLTAGSVVDDRLTGRAGGEEPFLEAAAGPVRNAAGSASVSSAGDQSADLEQRDGALAGVLRREARPRGVESPAVPRVALSEQGELTGRAGFLTHDQKLIPVSGTIVRIKRAGQTVQEVTTDIDGRFRVRGLKNGEVYSLAAIHCGRPNPPAVPAPEPQPEEALPSPEAEPQPSSDNDQEQSVLTEVEEIDRPLAPLPPQLPARKPAQVTGGFAAQMMIVDAQGRDELSIILVPLADLSQLPICDQPGQAN